MKKIEKEIGNEIDFGKVEIIRIIFSSKDSDFHIVSGGTNEYGIVTFTNCAFPVREAGFYKITGIVVKDGKYGIQVKTTYVEEFIPEEPKGLREFLKGKSIRGLGPVYADRLVDMYKMDTIRILDEEPERITEVKGIGEKRMNLIRESWKASRAIRELMIFLRGCGLTESFAFKLYKRYGKDCINVIKNNPYKIIDDIDGAGFKKADAFALELGYDRLGAERIRHAAKYILETAANSNGHCFLYGTDVLMQLNSLLDISDNNLLWGVIKQMRQEEELRLFKLPNLGNDCLVYLPKLYEAEKAVSENIKRILDGKRNLKINIEKEVEKIKKRAAQAGITYADSQLEAMRGALKYKFFIVTGGPGTGKTTIIKEIIESYESKGLHVSLAAPTGRASKRMQETTGREAFTIHKTFQFKTGADSSEDFEYLDTDVLIIDETSMVNILLTARFLKRIKQETIVIFVGDVDQLPPIGPGFVLRDLIDSGVVPFARLSQIYRQGKESQITVNAHKINNGEVPDRIDGDINPEDDFCYISVSGESTEDINETVQKKLIDIINRIEDIYGYSKEDVQILCPIKKGTVGTYELNKIMQNILNSDGFEFYPGTEERGGMRVHDKVMQVANNYDKNVFNGDVGYITGFTEEEDKLSVLCDGELVSYELSEIDQLQLAYACTVHKSQGSQYPVVIMPVTYSSYSLLQRNLLYTAVTRAEKLFILIGDKRAINQAVKNNKVETRNTMLKILLVNALGNTEI